MRYLLYSLMIMGSSVSFSQQETTVKETSENGVVTEKTTVGNTTVVTKKKESRLNVQQLARPKVVRKESVVKETTKKN